MVVFGLDGMITFVIYMIIFKAQIFEIDDCNCHNHVDFVHFEQCNDEAFCFKARFLARAARANYYMWYVVAPNDNDYNDHRRLKASLT